MSYHIFVRFAKQYGIEKDNHDYPVDSKYANRKEYYKLVEFIHGEKCDFEKNLFRIMTKLYGGSNLLFLDNGKTYDFEKLFY
jgi:hypothetical protein